MALIARLGECCHQTAFAAMELVVAGRGWQPLSLTQASLGLATDSFVVRSVNHTQLYEGML